MFGRRKRPRSIVDSVAMYHDLRAMVLGVDPAEHGIAPHPDAGIFGGMMELRYDQHSVTVVGLTDGTTSLYSTSGFGVIGGGSHAVVRTVTAAFVAELARFVDDFEPVSEVPPPEGVQVQFVVLSADGHRATRATEGSLRSGESPLSSLYIAGQRVMTELRRLDERHRRSR